MKVVPDTTLGRVSARLLAASAAIFIVAIVFSIAIDQGGSDVDKPNDLIRGVLGFGFLISGLGALIASAIAIVRDRERSLLAFLALAFGMFAVAFVFGDIVFPD